MTETKPRRPVERAADDLLMVVTKANVLGVDTLDTTDLDAALLDRLDDVVPALKRRCRGSRLRESDVIAGAEAASAALVSAAREHVVLSAMVVQWAAERTGLNAALVLREVLHTDDEGAL